ncbi:MAG: hypothetical protein C5B53_09935 [Candidatus Melainabacteria bacterium]|nr:MAG: hypothetical protein C5B53_09935 [Candidatus Melainabacteria bacterium]
MLASRLGTTILLAALWASASRPADELLPYQTKSFESAIDGKRDIFAFAPANEVVPASKAVLMVYLHGLGQNHSEPFKVPLHGNFASCLKREFPSLEILSLNYGILPSWCKETVREDISLNIRQVLAEHPADRIVVAGSSMGACSALTYVACAPKGIKDKIIGVIVVYPSGDLIDLHDGTSAVPVRIALEQAFGGSPARQRKLYNDSSLKEHLHSFPAQARVCVIEGLNDTVVPVKEQRDVVSALTKIGIATQVLEVKGNHQPPSGKLIVAAMDFVMGKTAQPNAGLLPLPHKPLTSVQ